MVTKLLVKVALLLALVSCGHADDPEHIYASVDNLIALFKPLRTVANFVELYSQGCESGNEQVKRFASLYDGVSSIDEKDEKKFVSNPVNAYLLIRMLTEDLSTKYKKLSGDKFVPVEYLDVDLMPKTSDLNGAMTGLNRLIQVYHFSLDDVIKGKFSATTKAIRPLDAFDTFLLANNSMADEDYDLAYLWANKTLHLLSEQSNPFVDWKQVYNLYALLSHKQGKIESVYWYLREISMRDPKDAEAAGNLAQYTEFLKTRRVMVKFEDAQPLKPIAPKNASSPEIYVYEKMCREDKTYFKPAAKQLNCRYVKDHPYLLIGPVKEETVLDDPPILIYYDTLTEKQAEQLKQMAAPKIKRAPVYDHGVQGYSRFKVAQMYYFREEARRESILKSLDYLVNAVSKLSMKEADPWQIANYGIGGQYEPHTDHKYNGIHYVEMRGDRIATWLNYIEAPEVGGDTVFVNLGVKTRAFSRSSVFWYNLKNDMTGTLDSIHAACPVVVGSKWISNKWIRQNDQMFIKPCAI